MFLKDITVLSLFYFSFNTHQCNVAKGGSSLVSLNTPGDSDFIIDLVVINIVSEDFSK